MPAPPKPGESQSDFIGRCVPVFIDEGRPKDQAVAICYDMWRKKHPGSKSEDYQTSGNQQDYVPDENTLSKPYEIGDIVKYDDKIGKIVKIIE